MSDLQSIDGLGNTTEKKLNDIGVTSITTLANTPLSDLQDAGIGENTSKTIKKQAEKKGVLIKRGPEVASEQNSKEYVSTGIDGLDDALGGGWEPGFLAGIAGETKAGKTQMIFQAIVSAVESTGDPAVYIETEPERFRANRIQEMCSDVDNYAKIYKLEAHDSLEQQRLAYESVIENFDDVSFVALDSFSANFRLSDRFEGREDLPARNNEIARHLRGLQRIGEEKECPTMMALQVMGNPDPFDNQIPVWGGSLMHHTMTCMIFMAHGKGDLREAQLRGHPGREDASITIKITNNGVETA